MVVGWRWVVLVACFASSLGAAEEAVELVRSGAPTLCGTLLVPDGVTGVPGVPGVPGVLLIAGSGPTDRDGNQAGLVNDHLTRLAEGLHAAGLAVLRFDKRGSAGTPLAVDPAVGEEALTPRVFGEDAAAWTRWLAADPRVGAVTLIGHSEGATLALLVAADPAVSAVATVAGPGRPLGAVLREQHARNLGWPLVWEAEAVLKELEAGERVPRVSPPLAPLYRSGVQPYVIASLRLDPAALAAAVEKPLLVVQGGRDVQVSAEDGRLLHAAAPGSTLLELPEMNHVLRNVAADEPPLLSYTQPVRPLAAGLVEGITAFVGSSIK